MCSIKYIFYFSQNLLPWQQDTGNPQSKFWKNVKEMINVKVQPEIYILYGCLLILVLSYHTAFPNLCSLI